MHEELINVIVAQVKNAADEQALSLKVDDGEITHCHTIELLGYSITGSVSAVPPLVVLSFEQSDSVAHFLSLKTASRNRVDRVAFVLLYPPGGAVTESRYRPAVLHRSDGGHINLTDARITLRRFDPATEQFVPWNDWTACSLTMSLVRLRDRVMRKL